MTRSRALVGFMGLALLAWGCQSPAPRTEVMLIIDAEPTVSAGAAALRVQIFGGDFGSAPEAYELRYANTVADPSFPRHLALVPLEPGLQRVWRAEVAVLDAAETVLVSTAIRGEYVMSKTVAVDLLLETACLGVLCARERCLAGECVDPNIDVRNFPEYDAGL